MVKFRQRSKSFIIIIESDSQLKFLSKVNSDFEMGGIGGKIESSNQYGIW